MTLTIHKLSTRCRSPKTVERASALVEETARQLLPSELGDHLGPSLDRLPEVVRLKQLRVQVKVPARKLNARSLASIWARALTLSLHQALAHPPGDGASISLRRYESDVAYKAAMLHHLATQGVRPCWEFPELQQRQGASSADATASILAEDPAHIFPVMAEMELHGWLDSLLASLDELSLERIMQAVASTEADPAGLSLQRFLELGNAASRNGQLRRQWAFAGRRQAIRLWTRLHPRFTLRDTWHGLRLWLRFLEMPALLSLRDPALLADAIPYPPWCAAIVSSGATSSEPSRTLATSVAPSTALIRPAAFSSAPRQSSAELFSILRALQPLVPSASTSLISPGAPAAATPGASLQWMVSDCAGILLMTLTVQRLNLWRFAHTPDFKRSGGPRAFSFWLAAIGMKLFRNWKAGDPIDPAVALFAGILGAPDVAGMREFFARTDVAAVSEFVQADTWNNSFEAAATELARSFAARVCGFRRASREAVVRQFLRVRGRICVEPARVLAVLDRTPWSVALRLSGMDAPIQNIEWLEQRRMEFVLEGL